MTISPSEWDAFLKANPPRGFDPEAMARHKEGAKIVAWKLEALQGMDEWAVYRSHVEQIVAAMEDDFAALTASLVTLRGDALLDAQGRAREVTGGIRAWKDALALPERLRQRAETAAH